MQKSKVEKMSHSLDRRDDEAGGLRHLTAVLFATLATVALVLGLGFAGPFASDAEAQEPECVVNDPTEVKGKVLSAQSTNGAWPSHEIFLQFPETLYVSEIIITSKVKLGDESNGKWGIELGGTRFDNGDGVAVSFRPNSTGSVTYKFDRPVPVAAGSNGSAFVTLFGQSGGSSNYTVTYKGSRQDPCPPSQTTSEAPGPSTTAEPEPSQVEPEPTLLPEPEPQPTTEEPTRTTEQPAPTSTQATQEEDSDPSTDNSPAPSSEEQPETSEPPAPVEDPTPRRDPRLGEQRLTVSARAFAPMFKDTSVSNHNARVSTDYRFSQGIRFELWTASNDLGDALRDGPQQKVNEPWAYCVTDSRGECDIFIPDWYLGSGKRFYAKQVTTLPGTFHIDKINWGKYGRANDRFEAYLPGPTDMVRPNGRNIEDRSYEIPRSERLSGDEVYSVNSNLHRPASQWSSFGSSVQSLNNPPLEQARKCQASGGPKIALVMDITQSIKKDGSPDQYRKAVYGETGFLESLRGTGAEIAMFNFNESSPGEGQNYPDLLSVDSSMETLKRQAERSLSDFDDGTNWESGLEAARSALVSGKKYDEVIFITDGDANGYGKNGGGDYHDGRSGYVRAVEAAIYRANDIKAMGTRIVSIGVGSAEDASNWDGSGQLEAISGLKYGVDYFGTDWDQLAATLRAAASQVTCQNEIIVDKTIVDSNGNKIADQSAANDWKIDVDVDEIVSEINWSHDSNPVQPAVLSPNSTVSDDNVNPLRIHDRQPTPKSRWFLTFYGNAEPGSDKANRADITIAEDVGSRAGYNFVPGTGQKRSGGYLGKGSWYEIRNLRYNTVLETGPVTNPKMKFSGLPQDRKLIVHLQNRPSVAVQKGATKSSVQVDRNNSFSATYEVRARGTSDTKTRIPRIVDKPQFPKGFTVREVYVDGIRRNLQNGTFEVAAEGSRWLSKTDTAVYNVEVRGVYERVGSDGKLIPVTTLGDELNCKADGSDGPGKGLFNQVYMTPDMDGETNNRACIPIVPVPPKKPVVEKTFVEVTQVPNSTTGEQMVSYRLTVKGDPTADMDFDLVDRPWFANGIEIHGAQARFIGGSANGNPGLESAFSKLTKGSDTAGDFWTVTKGTIPRQGVFEYEIQFRVSGLDKVKPDDRKCQGTGQEQFRRFEQNEGFYNQATLGWGSGSSRQTQDVDACGDINVEPRLEVAKTVSTYPFTLETNGKLSDDRASALQYQISVTNNGTGPGKYTLEDWPQFASGVDLLGDHHNIVSAEVVNATTGEKTKLSLPGYTLYVDQYGKPVLFGFAKDLEIKPNTTHVYTVQLAYGERTDFFENANQRDYVCSSTPGEGRKGLNNKAQLVSVKNPANGDAEVKGEPGQYVDYACANVPPQPKITKTLTNSELSLNDTVTYDVTVANPEGGVTRRIDVTDTPRFGKNVQVDPKSVTVDGQQVIYQPGQELSLGTIELAPGQSRTFTVAAAYKATGAEAQPDADCSASDYGLNNTGTIYFAYFPDRSEGKRPNLSLRDQACGLVRADLKIGVQKLVAEGGETKTKEPGAYEFVVREAESTEPHVLNGTVRADGVEYSTADLKLKLNTQYLLTETRAPKGYSLLAAPIKFRIVQQKDGYSTEFFDPISSEWEATMTNVSARRVNDDPALQIISVTDVTTGSLPRTGGAGIGAPVTIAVIIIGLGCVALRRRAA